jgi:hypothetical protein
MTAHIIVKHVSRARDEELLAQIAARARGVAAYALARHYGVNNGILITATNNVLAADLAESGEDPETVWAAYWRAGK